MPVVSLQPGYRGNVTDRVENFHGQQLLFVRWDGHLNFCSPITLPIPPDLTFGAFVETVLPATTFASDPDWAHIDWARTEWSVSEQRVAPDPALSLAALGIGHKAFLSFRTFVSTADRKALS
ncbi:phenol hydroxylase [Burkholderia pseudomultivorans]|uniref:Phenol hydroxylase n=1 Tax=Burkholderia pseudomultivorans TaxID=1207504 RepID=A0A6P2MJ65_9BURK|nr:phenol hydroxylase subunit P4 [Burkholderia pseudomultivorans]VWB80560.1 phenol hydroxylase [Burkholderia pseudomultivorans]